MTIPSLTYDVHDEPHYFYVFVMAGGTRVGQLLVERAGTNRARLSDIKVVAEYKSRRNLADVPVKARRHRSAPIGLRNHGIGSSLLDRLAEWCASRGIDEVYGSVVQSDLQETPSLLEWYEKRGFKVGEPSEECLPYAVKMVLWKRHETRVEEK